MPRLTEPTKIGNSRSGDAFLNIHDVLDAAQNARLVTSAERYYRIMYYGGAESWNLRDTHIPIVVRPHLVSDV